MNKKLLNGVRTGLGLLLLGLPLLFYAAVIVGDVWQYGTLMRPPGPERVLAFALSYGWPMLLAGLVSSLLLWLGRLVGRRLGASRFFLIAQTWRQRLGYLSCLALLAYATGCLTLWLLPRAVLYFYATNAPTLFEEYDKLFWWPFDIGTLAGWTIYPPLGTMDPGFRLLPYAEASCVKLGVLLAVLVIRPFNQKRLQ